MQLLVWVCFSVKVEDKNMGPLSCIYHCSVSEFSGSLQQHVDWPLIFEYFIVIYIVQNIPFIPFLVCASWETVHILDKNKNKAFSSNNKRSLFSQLYLHIPYDLHLKEKL